MRILICVAMFVLGCGSESTAGNSKPDATTDAKVHVGEVLFPVAREVIESSSEGGALNESGIGDAEHKRDAANHDAGHSHPNGHHCDRREGDKDDE